jgi:hypothetical protein
MSWKKELLEHPWTTPAQAKRIAKDHAKKKREKAAATLRFRAIKGHYKEREGLFHQKVPLQYLPELTKQIKKAEHKADKLKVK